MGWGEGWGEGWGFWVRGRDGGFARVWEVRDMLVVSGLGLL